MNAPNHYEVLGLSQSATLAEITARYQELARLYQADAGSARAPSGMFALIQEAFRVLSDPEERARYDATLRRSAATAAEAGEAEPSPTDREREPTASPPSEPALSSPPNAEPGSSDPVPERERETKEAEGVSQEEADRRLAQELARRGVPPDEIERLVALGREEATAKRWMLRRTHTECVLRERGMAQRPDRHPSPPFTAPPELPPSRAYVPRPTITLPPFRAPTPEQRADADRLLTAANVARRRGNFKEAEKICREAIELAPQDAVALELYGDILQAVGRVDDALYAYQRASEADPHRQNAERKYAELLLLQNREIELLREEYIPRNPTVAAILSALLPGAGQFYNGEPLKGTLLALCALACVLLLGWTPYGIPGAQNTIPGSLLLLLVLTGALIIYAAYDANLRARTGKRRKSGWDV